MSAAKPAPRLTITEFRGLAYTDVTAQFPGTPIAHQAVDISTVPIVVNPLDDDTRLVRLFADAPCYVGIGDGFNDKPGLIPLGANQPEVFGLGRGMRITVVAREQFKSE